MQARTDPHQAPLGARCLDGGAPAGVVRELECLVETGGVVAGVVQRPEGVRYGISAAGIRFRRASSAGSRPRRRAAIAIVRSSPK